MNIILEKLKVTIYTKCWLLMLTPLLVSIKFNHILMTSDTALFETQSLLFFLRAASVRDPFLEWDVRFGNFLLHTHKRIGLELLTQNFTLKQNLNDILDFLKTAISRQHTLKNGVHRTTVRSVKLSLNIKCKMQRNVEKYRKM